MMPKEVLCPKAAVDDQPANEPLAAAGPEGTRSCRLAALRNTDLTNFVLQLALREAKAVIEEAERITLSQRDTRLWLDLLDNPPKPNRRLIAAIKALPKS